MGVNFKKISKFVLLVLIVFALGWTASSISSNNALNLEKPLSTLRLYATGVAPELNSPGDWVKDSQIHVYDDRVLIELENPSWTEFTNTNSMDSIFDKGHNTVRIRPAKPEKIQPGDIISYKPENEETIIIHRVIETGYDTAGWFAIAQGDNLPAPDPDKIRFDQVLGVTVMIIY